jgi:hypothetical protein
MKREVHSNKFYFRIGRRTFQINYKAQPIGKLTISCFEHGMDKLHQLHEEKKLKRKNMQKN